MIGNIKFIKEWQAIVCWKKSIYLYRCSVNVRQCQILYLQVQIHNNIHTTLGCLPVQALHVFISFSENYVRLLDLLLFSWEAFFFMRFTSDIIQCNFILVSFLSNRLFQSFFKKTYYCVKREILPFVCSFICF